MNHIFRVVWNINNACWQAVSEVTKGKTKSTSQHKRGLLKQAFQVCSLSMVAFFSIQAMAAPTGGVVTHGAATISASGTTTTINQSTPKAVIDWTTFSTVSKETINFVQPSTNSIVLNRVIGTSSSTLYGALNANGQVFIVNPRGMYIGAPARINVGGLVASTLNLTGNDFMNNNLRFVSQQYNVPLSQSGQITVPTGGTVALISPRISQGGAIVAPEGNVLLAAGTDVTLNLNNGSLISYTVDAGRAGAIIDATGSIQADGGKVILTAQGVNALSNAVVNNSGIIQARTVNNKQGVIELSSDMLSGKVNVTGGTLDASASVSGYGGAITTSAKNLNIANGVTITTKSTTTSTLPPASSGWEATANTLAIQTPDGISASSLSTALNNGNVTLNAVGAADGDININSAVNWSGNTVLTLNASKDININQNIALTGLQAKLSMVYGNGYDYKLADGVKVDITGSPAGLSINGTEYTVVNSLGVAGDTSTNTLQGMENNLTGNYALGRDIDASATVNWNSGQGFNPIGTALYNHNTSKYAGGNDFSGEFHGLGHTVDSLYMHYMSYDPTLDNAAPVGLFSSSTNTLRDIGITNTNISNLNITGGLVGVQRSGTVKNAYSSGIVNGRSYVGGLIGLSGEFDGVVFSGLEPVITGEILNSHSTSNVKGTIYTGGLIGASSNPIYNSYATGAISFLDRSATPEQEAQWATSQIGGMFIGGLAGLANGIYDSYATGAVNAKGIYINGNYYNTPGALAAGGLVGGSVSSNSHSINNSYATGNVSGFERVGGLVGWTIDRNLGATTSIVDQLNISNSYTTGNVSGDNYIGGLVGYNSKNNVLSNNYATGNITGILGVGGLVGLTEASISNSYAVGTVNGVDGVGGLAGGVMGQNGVTLSNSYATGNVTGTNVVGGLVGQSESNIEQSYATGNVTGTGMGAGGLVGIGTNRSINNSYALGSVTGNLYVGGLVGATGRASINNSYSAGLVVGNTDVGGLIGYNEVGDAVTTISNSYWNTDTSGQTTSAGGVGKTTAQLQQISTFSGWDIANVSNPTSTSIWVIDEGNAMPTLRDNP